MATASAAAASGSAEARVPRPALKRISSAGSAANRRRLIESSLTPICDDRSPELVMPTIGTPGSARVRPSAMRRGSKSPATVMMPASTGVSPSWARASARTCASNEVTS
nr:hypothetical protein [Nannocystis sp.]